MKFIHIVAICPNHGIGHQNELLYRNSDDLKRFKQLTTGHTVVMGRKTFESLNSKPLPNRLNIVLSRDPKLGMGWEEAKQYLAQREQQGDPCVKKVYIIGGGEIYKMTMGEIDRIELTQFYDTPTKTPDVFYPKIDMNHFAMLQSQSLPRAHGDDDERPFLDYVTLVKRV